MRYLFIYAILSVIALSQPIYCPPDEIWPQTRARATAVVDCDSGSLSRYCTSSGRWQAEVDKNCQCAPSTEVPVKQKADRGQWYDHRCDAGYLKLYCNVTGTWDMNQIMNHRCACNAKDDFPKTGTDSVASRQCTVGTAERFCDFGAWQDPDYRNCFDVTHTCETGPLQKVSIAVTPSFGYKNVEVCVLIKIRGAPGKVTVDDIKAGTCSKKRNEFGQYIFDMEIPPHYYNVYAYAHSDHTFVSIPALNQNIVDGEFYEYYLKMHNCAAILEYVTSDSYSISLKGSYVWSYPTNPTVILYYTDNMKFTVNDLVHFKSITYTGQHGYYELDFLLEGLKPGTQYQFYMVVQQPSASYPNIKLTSNNVRASTYPFCNEAGWPVVPVDSTADQACTVGKYVQICNRGPNYTAVFGNMTNECFCPEEYLNGVLWPQTLSLTTATIIGVGSRECLYGGIWSDLPTTTCEGDGHWPPAREGEDSVIKCGNDGQLVRKCTQGSLGPIVDMNCKCRQEQFETIDWASANRGETQTHSCMTGNLTRTCDEFGQWKDIADNGCMCLSDGHWDASPRNKTTSHTCTIGETSRVCKLDGTWSNVNNNKCFCEPVFLVFPWPQTNAGKTAIGVCGVGKKTRVCGTFGIWEEIVNDNCQCEETGAWEQTIAGETDMAFCPESTTDTMTRKCGDDGWWTNILDVSQCGPVCLPIGRFDVTKVERTQSVICEGGGGKLTMDCIWGKNDLQEDVAVWDDDSWALNGICFCAAHDFFPITPVTETATINCDLGNRTNECWKYSARWQRYSVNNNCQCSWSHREVPDAIITNVFLDNEAPCDDGYRTLECRGDGHYHNGDNSMCFCEADTIYPQTRPETTAAGRCPERGDRNKMCDYAGYWDLEENNQCKCDGIANVLIDLLRNETYLYECPVGKYSIFCTEQAITDIIEESCACEASNGFPSIPAGDSYEKACGNNFMKGKCDIHGQWSYQINDCACAATAEYPRTPYGMKAKHIQNFCYEGYCNPDTGLFERVYDQCFCPATEIFPLQKHNETVRIDCGATGGYTQGVCLEGYRFVTTVNCDCINPKNGDVVPVGDYIAQSCMTGYLLKQCRSNNIWFDILDAYCGCSSSESGIDNLEIVDAGTTKTADCGAGTITLTCKPDGWYDMSTLENNCKCAADGLWPETERDSVAEVSCENSSDVTRRTCGTYGEWLDEPTQVCKCPANMEWPESLPGTHEIECTATTGITIERECKVNGVWGDASGSCIDKSCPKMGPFPVTQDGDSASVTCGNGEVVTSTCTEGVWSTVNWSHCKCEALLPDWPETAVGITLQGYSCGVGRVSRECKFGIWGEIDFSNCYCAANGPLARTEAESTVVAQCAVGRIEATCNERGVWVDIKDSCECGDDFFTVEGVVFRSIGRGKTQEVFCMEGSMKRLCTMAGVWASSVDYSQCFCTDPNWGKVPVNSEAQLACDQGYMSRRCTNAGQWGQAHSENCGCQEMENFPVNGIIGTTSIYQCSIGSLSASCSEAGWSAITNNGCQCNADQGFGITPYKTEGEKPCDTNFKGKVTRTCNELGVWLDDIDTSECIAYCPAMLDWPATEPGTTATKSCPAGYSGGDIKRTCSASGSWNVAVNTCVPLECAANDGFPRTNVFSFAHKACGDGFMGSYDRQCTLVGNNAVWGAVVNNCVTAQCTLGDQTYQNGYEMIMACNQGEIGQRTAKCTNGVFVDVENSCTVITCAANPSLSLPSDVFGSIRLGSCGYDMTGVIRYVCNAVGEWELFEGSCAPIEPIIRCFPEDNSENVSLSAIDEEGVYTVRCTSNVRIASVNNDKEDNMNVHALFMSDSGHLSYAMENVFLSNFTYAFVFEGSFPPGCNGQLYINAKTFTSAAGIQFPSSSLMHRFTTRLGRPLAPLPLFEVSIVQVFKETRTVKIKIELPFNSDFYDEAQIIFIGSNLQAINFASTAVFVDGVIINSVVAMSWRVRKGEFWSLFSETYVYQPIVLLPPDAPTIKSYYGTSVTFAWRVADVYNKQFDFYEYQVGSLRNKVTSESVTLTLPAGISHKCRVRVCVVGDECSDYSEYSPSIILAAVVIAPASPRDLVVTGIASTAVKLNWNIPEQTGGASITKYIVRMSDQANMSNILRTAESTTTSLTMSQVVKEGVTTFYFDVAAYNGGYTSSYCSPATYVVQPLTVSWTSNNDDGNHMDSYIIINGQFNYLSMVKIVITDPNHSEFKQKAEYSATSQVSKAFGELVPGTTYKVHCEVKELNADSAVIVTDFEAYTILSIDFTPVVTVQTTQTEHMSAIVRVSSNVLGTVRCFIDLLDNGHPSSLNPFSSLYAQSKVLTNINEMNEFTFFHTYEGALFDHESIYHAWCVLDRVITKYSNGVSYTEHMYYPDYTSGLRQGRRRRLLQSTEFEITSITPDLFAVDVSPHATIQIKFSEAVEFVGGEGMATLLSSSARFVEFKTTDVVCVDNVCEMRVRAGMNPNDNYVLNINENAFKSLAASHPLSQPLVNHVFSIGFSKCDTDFIGEGLSDTKICKCVSGSDTCECNCGKTSIIRKI